MEWRELQSDVTIENLSSAFRHLDCLSALQGMANFARGVGIYATRSCVGTIKSHVESSRKEVGGLLLGNVFRAKSKGWSYRNTLIILTRSVPSVDYRNSSVSLEMGTEIWSKANEHIEAGDILVGWYHSHPGLGAFFSGTDRRTQAAFFIQEYSLGLVIDPLRDEQKLFCGPESKEYEYRLLEIDDGLALAQSH